jgi:hypothetical protein
MNNKLLALAWLILGIVMCVVVYWGIADGEIGLSRAGGHATRAHDPIAFWVITAFRSLIPVAMFSYAIVLLRKK